MVGLLFIVNVPRKEYEEMLTKKDIAKFNSEQEKIEKASEIVRELKENKKFGSLTHAGSIPDDISIPKCKSTESLHKEFKADELYKCKSENTLNDNNLSMDDNTQRSNTSWEDIKHVIKPRRHKLKITKPVRGVDILSAFRWDTPLETILSEIIARLGIIHATWSTTRDNSFWKVIFAVESGNLCEELLQVLRTFGIGSRHLSSVSVIPCTLYYKSTENDNQTPVEKEKISQCDQTSVWTRFSSSVRARTNLAQVLHAVKADAALTFDWVFLLVVAAFVAALGLVENSTVILVASMLISPLMGPLTAATMGSTLRDRSMLQMGLIHEMLGLFLCVVIGFIFGLAICAVDEHYGSGDWPTYEMMSRCEIRSLWVGVLIAIPSGVGVALAVLGDYTASLVGVAISASLLPPAVNAGLLWAMALVHLIFAADETRWTDVITSSYFSSDPATELALLGTVSLCLTLVNIICIFIAGVAVYRVKEVCPLDRRDIAWWRENRNRLQASLKNKECDDKWNVYSKWCNEPDDIKQEMVTKETDQGLVHGDTVTYRKHQIGKRPKAQLIEDYCYEKEKIKESYIPLDIETQEPADSNAMRNCINKIPKINVNWHVNLENSKYSEPDDHSFYNMGFEEDTKKDTSSQPTIEPSMNHTVNAKNYGVVLENKSFHV